MHKNVLEVTTQERESQRVSLSRNCNFPYFGLGDYVLVAIPEKNPSPNYILFGMDHTKLWISTIILRSLLRIY